MVAEPGAQGGTEGAEDGPVVDFLYANEVEIGFSAIEFRFRFRFRDAHRAGPDAAARQLEVVMAPATARLLADLLQRCLATAGELPDERERV
jgi:hypothetical protein